jgi:hypothetical protein
MSARGRILLIMLLATVIGGLAGLYRIVLLRFESGDIFPASSTLRDDPLGSKALFMSLEQLAGLKVSRNHRPLDRITGSQDSTVFLLGAHASLLDSPDARLNLERIAATGSRIVISLNPQTAAFEKQKPDPKENKPPVTEEKKPEAPKGFGIKTIRIERSEKQLESRMVGLSNIPQLPQGMPFVAPLALKTSGPEWNLIYSVANEPVIIERRYGQGSIVLITENFLLSNEAMRDSRHPELISWLVGPGHTVIFDETHLGVAEESGIISLIRRFGLLPFAGSLLLLALLYLWRSSLPLIPSDKTVTDQSVVAAGNHFSGLVNLLRRSINQKDLLKTCWQEWQKSAAVEIRKHPGLSEEMRQLTLDNSNPVAQYNRISRLRTERKLR